MKRIALTLILAAFSFVAMAQEPEVKNPDPEAVAAEVQAVNTDVQAVAAEGGCGVVREFVGHGIGREMHEEPQVPNFGRAGRGPVLEEGMVFCIEPMFTRGSPAIRILEDGWTVVTRDGQPAAHFEHTVAIGPDGAEILTPREG